MNTISTTDTKSENPGLVQKTIYSVLFSIAFAHLINDLMQSVIPAAYPILKENFNLNFTQIGLITFVYQLTASLLQPFIGFYTDKKPKPYSLAIGMVFNISSGSVPRRFFRLWGKKRFGAIHLSVGWQYRKCHRTIVSRYNCGTLRTIEYHMVRTSRYFRNIRFD